MGDGVNGPSTAELGLTQKDLGVKQKQTKFPVPTQSEQKLDALVVLGKGLNYRKDEKTNQPLISKQPLSERSRLNVQAAGRLFQQEAAENIILTGGQTKGKKWTSEAEAMRAYLKKNYPDIPEDRVIIEKESIDTAQNAEKVKALLEKIKAQKIGIVSTGDHLRNSKTLFENHGVGITRAFASEDIVRGISPRHARYVEGYLQDPRRRWERRREAVRGLWLKIDRKGRLIRPFTRLTRSGIFGRFMPGVRK